MRESCTPVSGADRAFGKLVISTLGLLEAWAGYPAGRQAGRQNGLAKRKGREGGENRAKTFGNPGFSEIHFFCGIGFLAGPERSISGG